MQAAATGRVRIGISGWRYAPWRGAFYPEKLAQHRELAFASRTFETIEINGSFYSLQRASSWQAWFDATPEDFVFAVKGPRYITHILRLREVDQPLAEFFASGVLRLAHKLGPFLWQFPPNFAFDPASFEPFLASLPFDTDHARAIAARHRRASGDPPSIAPAPNRLLRHAVEVRHPSFVDPDFIRLLRQYGVAFVSADTAARWPEFDDVSADFAYLRLHGSAELYRSAYSDAELDRWAERVAAARSGEQAPGARLIAPALAPTRGAHDVFCYFDNTDKLEAPRDALRLRERLRGGASEPADS